MSIVAVYPAAALHARGRLFAALAEAFDVEFRASDTPATSRADAAILFADGDERLSSDGSSRRCFVVAGAERDARRQTVRFSASSHLDPRLRNRHLVERDGAAAVVPSDADEVLAETERTAVWVRRTDGARSADVVASAPRELGPDEFLRDHMDPGRFLGLLPLVHFLRRAFDDVRWRGPSEVRAVFVVDDPNLHWHSYGYLDYRHLVRHAERHRYHIAMAMIPLDAWYAHRPVVRLFSEHEDVLSLCVHGNDHRFQELGRVRTEDEARTLLLQAMSRVRAFERRTGLRVSRVMVPPHEACARPTMEVMAEVGIDAATMTRPYPWLPFGPGYSSYVTPDGENVLSGWHMAELVPGDLPVIIRREFHEHDEIVLRALLEQPIVLYGHVSDFADGLAPLEAAADAVNALPDVSWLSLDRVATTNYETRREGAVLAVRTFSRRIRVDVAPDVSTIRLETPPGAAVAGDAAEWTVEVVDGADPPHPHVEGGVVELAPERDRSVTLEVAWIRGRSRRPTPARRTAASALSRRLVVEARDRVRPFLGR